MAYDLHVAPHAKKGWQVRKAGADRALSTYPNQKAAIAAARELILKKAGPRSLAILDAQGYERETRSYS